MRLTRNLLAFVCCLGIFVVLGINAMAAQSGCIAIKDKILTYSATSWLGTQFKLLETRYDDYGYNYQAHMFNGSYFNAYANSDWLPAYEGDDEEYGNIAVDHWAWPWRTVTLQMKWNDAWLSNKDCSGDGVLDRHYGRMSYRGSGAWLTNHQSGSDTVEINGKMKTVHWTYFVKIVAAPGDATMGDQNQGQDPSMWYDADGGVIGPAIWGDFAVIQRVLNDPAQAIHGLLYLSPTGAGFGKFSPHP